MAFSRTRIWRGGNANFGLDGAPEDPEPGSIPLTPVPQSPAGAAPPRRTPVTTPASTPNQPPDAGYIPGFAPGAAREQAATRFLPIEELFPELASDAAPPASQPARAAQRAFVETPTGLRGAARVRRARWPILALALASVTLGATLWTQDLQVDLGAQLARAGAAQKRPSQPRAAATDRPAAQPQGAAPQAEAPASAASADKEDAAPPAPPSADSAAPLPPGLERAAIDALVAGDFARAEKLYARLARGAAPEPIREALRILSSQQDAHGP